MDNILKDIAKTPLEGSVLLVDTEDKCGTCGYIETYEEVDAQDPEEVNTVGDVWTAYCHGCRLDRVFTVVKVTVSERQYKLYD